MLGNICSYTKISRLFNSFCLEFQKGKKNSYDFCLNINQSISVSFNGHPRIVHEYSQHLLALKRFVILLNAVHHLCRSTLYRLRQVCTKDAVRATCGILMEQFLHTEFFYFRVIYHCQMVEYVKYTMVVQYTPTS